MYADTAVGAADEQAGAVWLQVRGGGRQGSKRLLLSTLLWLGGGSETHLSDQRLSPQSASRQHHWSVLTVISTLRLEILKIIIFSTTWEDNRGSFKKHFYSYFF